MYNLHLFCVCLLVATIALREASSTLVPTETIHSIQDGETKAKQYYFDPAENGLKPWFEAMEYCQMNGYEPGRVETAEENRLVARTLTDNFQSSHVFWLGATDWGQDGQFYWIRTGENLRYNNFAAGYPNGGRAESCIYVWGDGLWYDQYCTVREVRPLCQRVT